MRLEPLDVPLRMPHYAIREGELFFVGELRARARLSTAEAALLEAIDGSRTVATLEGMHPDASSRLRQWREHGVVAVCARAPSAVEHGPGLLVFEPHMDDAALSVGATLAAEARRRRVTVASVMSRSIHTIYLAAGTPLEYLDVARVTALRTAESEVAARIVGYEHVALGNEDSAMQLLALGLKDGTDGADLLQRYWAWSSFDVTQNEVAELARSLDECIARTRPAEVWAPLALGDHRDHVLVREAVLHLVAKRSSTLAGVRVAFFEDVPYRIQSAAHAQGILDALARHGSTLVRQPREVSDTFGVKLDALSAFQSQYELGAWRELTQQAAAAPDPNARIEVLHRLDTMGEIPSLSETSSVSDARAALREALIVWAAQARAHGSFAIVACAPLGQPSRFAQALARLLPSTRAELFVESRDATASEADPAWKIGPAPRDHAATKALVASLHTRGVPTMLLLAPRDLVSPATSALGPYLPEAAHALVPFAVGAVASAVDVLVPPAAPPRLG